MERVREMGEERGERREQHRVDPDEGADEEGVDLPLGAGPAEE